MLSLVGIVCGFFAFYLIRGLTFYQDDIENYHWPAMLHIARELREGSLSLWTPTMYAGYPFFADGTSGMLYPVYWLSVVLPAESVIMCLLALSMALSGLSLYAFARSLGLGPTAALLAGLTYAFCGYSVGHWIHFAIWPASFTLPLALLSVEKACRATGRGAVRWLLLAGLVQSPQWLAGHAQANVIAATALLSYGAFRLLTLERPLPLPRRLSYLLLGAVLVEAIGVGLAGVQFVPTAEMAALTPRGGGVSYEFASSHSLPPHNLLTAFWPLLFKSPDGFDWGLTLRWEAAFYVGLLPLLLAALALCIRRDRYVAFWALLGLLGLWIAMGRYASPNLHWLLYQLPWFAVFRVPARFLLWTDLALALLAGYGLEALVRSQPGQSRARALYLAAALAGLLAVAGLAIGGIALFGTAASELLWPVYLAWPRSSAWQPGDIWPAVQHTLSFGNAEWSVRGGLIVATVGLLLAFVRWPAMRHWPRAFVALVALDLAFFAAQFWHAAPPAEVFHGTNSPPAQYLLTHAGAERVFSAPGTPTRVNQLWGSGLREINSYAPYLPRRFADYLALAQRGDNRLLDLLSARWLVVPRVERLPEQVSGVWFDRHNPAWVVSQRSPQALAAHELALAKPFATGSVRLIGSLWFAAHVGQGERVAEIVLRAEDGREVVLPVRAGVDLAEMAAEREDVRPLLRHSPANVVRRDDAVDGAGRRYQNLSYFGELEVPDLPLQTSTLTIRAVEPTVDVRLEGLSLVSPAGDVLPVDRYADARYRERYRDGESRVLENLAALPRAFLVGNVRAVPAGADYLEEMARELREPREIAYIEGVGDFASQGEGGPIGTAELVAEDATRLAFAVDAKRSAFLLVSDLHYPGWTASVDGQSAPLLRADYVFRAVPIPPGRHEVVMAFDPPSFKLGLGLTVATALALLIATLGMRWSGGRLSSR